jgi:hypothetical protein
VDAPSDVFGLSFVGAAATGAAFCATAGATTKPQSDLPSAIAKVHLIINLLPRLAAPRMSLRSRRWRHDG